MNVVLLAAGLGSRLGMLTRDLPKALISVAGRPLLLHALSFAARLQPSRIVVVGGFGFAQVEDTLASFRAGDKAVASPSSRVGVAGLCPAEPERARPSEASGEGASAASGGGGWRVGPEAPEGREVGGGRGRREWKPSQGFHIDLVENAQFRDGNLCHC